MRDLIADLAVVEGTAAPGAAAAPLQLRRAWPRSEGELALEYLGRDDNGRPMVVAATWSETDGLTFVPATADADLPGLGTVLAEPGAHLLSHRAGTRAVVRLPHEYAKVVRPRRVLRLAETLRTAEQLRVAAPRVISVEAEAGVVRLAPLDGVPFGEVINRESATRVGGALRKMHAGPADAALSAHSSEDERHVVEKWLGHLDWLRADLAADARERARHVVDALADETPAQSAPIHRDLHDGQLVVRDDGSIGVLDFDTLARGEPALDLANLLVHLELAVLLGVVAREMVETAREALLAAYDPSPETARCIPAYADATRVRLVCVHAFRPGNTRAARALLDRVGSAV